MGLFKRQNIVTRADKISEFTVNTAEYGSVVPEVIGTTRISGNVIYYDDFTAHEHREETKSGKGGRTTQTNITYTYTVAVIFGLCEGEITGIGKVWRGKEVYYYPDSNIELTAFLGSASQQPWSYVTGAHPEKAMAYPGLAYMAGVIDMGNGATLPNFNFEVKGKLLSTGDGIDVNPADYIRYILDKVGLENVPVEGLDNFRTYCANNDLLISSPPDTNAKQAQAIVNEITKLTNAYFFWSNDRFKIVPLETHIINSWEPDNTIRYNLTSDDFLPQSNGALVTYSRKDSSEVYNSFPVEFINRSNGYEKETINYQLSVDIANYGLRQASTTPAHYVYTKERAVKVAEMLARKAQLERNTYTFKLDWAFCRLEPGDIVTITDANIGVEQLPVRISSINEETKGTITCTAVAVDISATAAEYDVHEVDRPFVDFNQAPPSVAQPLIIQPPADLTAEGLEIWIGAKGNGDNWGGCTVYVSDDNTNYRTVGQINNSARIGNLVSGITYDATQCEVTCNDVLLSGTEQDAERGNTLCWIGGECLSYETATLLQNGNYQLSGLIRGQYNTTAVAHNANEQFARLDNTLLKEAFRKEDIGKTIYLKFCSFNTFGAREQDLADVQPYQYTIQAYYIPAVQNLIARNRYRQLADGVNRYDVVVEWTPPDMQSYLEGRVWYKTNSAQVKYLNFQKNVAVNKLGFAGEWIFGGSGKNTVTIPQAIVGDEYRIAVTTVDIWGVETSPDASPQIDIKVALKTEIPNTPDGLGITFGTAAVLSWKEVTNSDIAFYEVRKDDMPGAENANLLARVTGLSTTLNITERTGMLYLYAYSASGKYSAPATLEYNKAAPSKPNAPTLTAKLGGFSVVAGTIPAGCTGMNVYIDNGNVTQVHLVNNVYTYTCDAGIYDVSVAYTDLFGEGTHSDASRITVKATVDTALLEAGSVTTAKLDSSIQATLDNVATNATSISNINNTIAGINSTINTVSGNVTAAQAKADAIDAELKKAPGSCNYKAITDLKTETGTISATVASNKTAQDTINGTQATWNTTNAARITVTENGISGIVANLNQGPGSTSYNSISQLNQTVNGLSSQVTQAITDLQNGMTGETALLTSQIEQNASDISAIVANLNQTPDSTTYSAISALKQQADTISSTVSTNKAAQDAVNTSQAAINAGTSSSGLKTLIETNTTSITQASNNISAIVSKLNSTTGILDYAGIDALADEIAAVDLKADGISTTVTNNKTAQDAINAGTSSSGLKTLIETNTSNITQTANSISAVITKLGGETSDHQNFTAIKALQDGIITKVSQTDLTQANGILESYLSQTAEGFFIKGSLIKITTDNGVIIGDHVITKNMIATKAISADKIDVDALSAISANLGTITTMGNPDNPSDRSRVVISGKLIEVYDSNNRLRVRLGVW